MDSVVIMPRFSTMVLGIVTNQRKGVLLMTDPEREQPKAEESAPINLGILGGQPGPEFLRGDIDTLLGLPETAQKKFWKVLGQCLDDDLGTGIDQMIDGFATQHDTEGSSVARAIRGCRFLLLEAARRNVEQHVLAADLGSLGGESADLLREILLQDFASTKTRVRSTIVRNALADHGRLMEKVTFRLDHMAMSQDGVIDAPVAVLTFTCREGTERARWTMYADLPALHHLRSTIDRIIGEPSKDEVGE